MPTSSRSARRLVAVWPGGCPPARSGGSRCRKGRAACPRGRQRTYRAPTTSESRCVPSGLGHRTPCRGPRRRKSRAPQHSLPSRRETAESAQANVTHGQASSNSIGTSSAVDSRPSCIRLSQPRQARCQKRGSASPPPSRVGREERLDRQLGDGHVDRGAEGRHRAEEGSSPSRCRRRSGTAMSPRPGRAVRRPSPPG